MKAADFRTLQADTMLEDELQSRVLQLASPLGWRSYHTHDSRRSPGGFPDLCLVHGRAARLIFSELKREKGRYQPGQREWLADLAAVGEAAHRDLLGTFRYPNNPRRILVTTWRPSDLLNGTIESILKETHP